MIDTGDMFAWDDNKFVLPTEYIEGGQPLDAFLDEDREQSLTFAGKADIIAKIASGLRHAHKAGVIHRDIRPRNVVIAPGGVAKLVNFDLALIRGYREIGDPKGLKRRLDEHYVAPEVHLDPSRATAVSDIYSLGIVFYELLVGKRPYVEVRDVIEYQRVPLDLDALRKSLSRKGSRGFMKSPDDVAAVIQKMCRLDPSGRYQSVDGVIEDLAIIAE
ncbi:MAG TPA: protein kinase [Planctomycetota bacterium]|nr:protein kinase [Planctomycetota bacterium]